MRIERRLSGNERDFRQQSTWEPAASGSKRPGRSSSRPGRDGSTDPSSNARDLTVLQSRSVLAARLPPSFGRRRESDRLPAKPISEPHPVQRQLPPAFVMDPSCRSFGTTFVPPWSILIPSSVRSQQHLATAPASIPLFQVGPMRRIFVAAVRTNRSNETNCAAGAGCTHHAVGPSVRSTRTLHLAITAPTRSTGGLVVPKRTIE